MADQISVDANPLHADSLYYLKLNEFEKELKQIVVESVENCSACYKLMTRLSKHIRDTHSSRIRDDPDQGHPVCVRQNHTRTSHVVPGSQNLAIANDNQFASSSRQLRKRKTINYVEIMDESKLSTSVYLEGRNPTAPSGEMPVLNPSQHLLDSNSIFLMVDDIKCEYEPAEDVEINEDPLYVGNDGHDLDLDDEVDKDFDEVHNFDSTSATEVKKPKKKDGRQYPGDKRYKCEYCDDYFNTKPGLYSHVRTHHENQVQRQGQCRICEEEFSSSKELADHTVESHMEVIEKPYNCMICGVNYCNALELNEHFGQIHPTNLPHHCKNCDKRFFDEADLNNHSLSHGEKNSYNCEHCNQGFKTTRFLQVHVKTHTNDKPYKCDSCEKCFNIKEHLEKHERIHTEGRQTRKSTTTQMKGKDQVACGICKTTFTSSKNLSIHLRAIHKDVLGQRCVCHICDEKFASKNLLTKHINEFHPGRTRLECELCHEKFLSVFKLKRHVRSHTGEKPYTCTVCSKAFRTDGELTAHLRVHTGEKPYKCGECDKCYSSGGALILHKRLHTGERPYLCEQCSKCFISKTNLEQHKRTHKEKIGVQPKPYSCDDCGKCFPSKNNLRKHAKIHTGVKPHLCEECGKSFLRSNHLTRHLKIHE